MPTAPTLQQGHMSAGYGVLTGSSELVGLGLLAARAHAASSRAAAGNELDDIDRRALESLASVLGQAADSLDFFGSSGASGSPPGASMMASVDVAIDTVIGEAGSVDLNELATRLRSSSDSMKALLKGESPSNVHELATFLAGLSSAVLRESGVPGETTEIL